MKDIFEDEYEMPDRTVDLLIRFLVQGNGKISKRAREKEFSMLTDDEVLYIEKSFKEIFQHSGAE